MKICCDSMRDAIASKGQGGFSIEISTPSMLISEGIPLMVFRAYDEGQDEHVQIKASIPVSLDIKVGFMFCPWCGQPVEESNSSSESLLDRAVSYRRLRRRRISPRFWFWRTPCPPFSVAQQRDMFSFC